MKFIGGFFKFTRRVLDAAKKGGLGAKDLTKLDRLFTRTGKRNAVLAKGILSALSAGGASDKDIDGFGELLRNAEDRIAKDQEPFTKKEREELSKIFERAYISSKAARWFSKEIDELLTEHMLELMEGKRRVEIGVPKKKTVKFDAKPKKKKKTKV